MSLDALTMNRLFGYESAFDHPVTRWIVSVAAALLVIAFLLIFALGKWGRLSAETYRELVARTVTWAWLVPLLFLPILAGAAWTMVGVLMLSILCYREYAFATGLFRHHVTSLVVVIGILALSFASVDHWYGFFVALPALGVVVLCAVSTVVDQPEGYIQRTALGLFAFLLFGFCLGHLSYLANDRDYRPILLLLLVTVEMNDIFAYLSGKLIGRRKLAPRTSPGKTVGGALGAMVMTTGLVVMLGQWVFSGTALGKMPALLGLGLVISLSGQFGDLMLSSIKRDLGIKDIGNTLPGHGGLLDRFDSLLLAAPAYFHYVGYFRGFGLDQPVRIFTG